MSKVKWLTAAVVVLLCMNIGLLTFGHFSGPGHDGPKKIVIERLHFDKAQVEGYSRLIEVHQTMLAAKMEEMNAARKALYATLAKPNSDPDPLFDRVAEIQTEIERIHVAHFAAIKGICRPDQLNDYNAYANDLSKVFGRIGPRSKGR